MVRLLNLILAVSGVVLLISAVVAGLCVVISFVRSPAGQHKDAGEGALTVAALQARHEQEQARKIDQTIAPTNVGLYGLDLVSGYVTVAVSGKHRSGELPGPSDWALLPDLETTRDVPVVEPPRALVGAA